MGHMSNHLSLLSINKAAKFMHIGHEKLNSLISSGQIRILEIGKRSYIPVSEIEPFYSNNLKAVQQKLPVVNNSKQPTFNSSEILRNIIGG